MIHKQVKAYDTALLTQALIHEKAQQKAADGRAPFSGAARVFRGLASQSQDLVPQRMAGAGSCPVARKYKAITFWPPKMGTQTGGTQR